jgi:hypothetical protein
MGTEKTVERETGFEFEKARKPVSGNYAKSQRFQNLSADASMVVALPAVTRRHGWIDN